MSSRREYLQWEAGLYAQREALSMEWKKELVKLLPAFGIAIYNGYLFGPYRSFRELGYDLRSSFARHPRTTILFCGLIGGANYWAFRKLVTFPIVDDRITRIDRMSAALTEETLEATKIEYDQIDSLLAPTPGYLTNFAARRALNNWIEQHKLQIIRNPDLIADLPLIQNGFELPPLVSRVLCSN